MHLDHKRLWSVEAEAAVLCSMMIEVECIPNVLSCLTDKEMFFLPANQMLFDAVTAMFIDETNIDGVTLRADLKRRGWLTEIGKEIDPQDSDAEHAGVMYIGRILQAMPHAANAVYYAKEVLERWNYRQAMSARDKISDVLQNYEPVAQMIAQIQEIVAELDASEEQVCQDMSGEEVMENIENPQDVIETGYRDLDAEVSLHRGELVIIAGRPSMGKSSLAVNIVQQMAEQGTSCLIVSLETKAGSITQRIMCRRAKVNHRYIEETVIAKLRVQVELVDKLPIVIADSVDTIGGVMSIVAKVKRSRGVDVVLIDYLQLLGTTGKYDNRNVEVAAISRALKRIAVREDVLMLVVCQLNRQVEQRNDRKPRMSDLRESGSLEQDADWIFLLYRADYYRDAKEDPDNIGELIIAKARDGKTGMVEMLFVPEYTSFETLTKVSNGLC